MDKTLTAVEEAVRAGFDLSLIEESLNYSYEQIAKEALGREKDLLAVKELKAIREKQAKP